MADNQFQTYIKFDISDAEAKIKKIEADVLRWKDAMSKLDESNKAAISSFQKTIAGGENSIAKLRDGIENAQIAQDKFINSTNGSFRALGSLDRVTREFASGSLTQGANGLSMFGNSLARIASTGGGVSNALSQIGTSLTGPAGLVLGFSLLVGLIESNKDALGAFFEKIVYGKNPLREQNSALIESHDTYVKSIVEIKKLTDAFDTQHTGTKTKKEVLDEYNKTLGQVYGSTKDINEAENIFKQNTAGYIEACKLRAAAEIEYKKAAEAAATAAETRAAPLEKFTPIFAGGGLGMAPLAQKDLIVFQKAYQEETAKSSDATDKFHTELAKGFQDSANAIISTGKHTKDYGQDTDTTFKEIQRILKSFNEAWKANEYELSQG